MTKQKSILERNWLNDIKAIKQAIAEGRAVSCEATLTASNRRRKGVVTQMEDEQIQTDCELCTIEQDLFIRLCPKHKAAPELLEALKSICSDDGHHYLECEDSTHTKYPEWVTVKQCVLITAAIAKATHGS